mgnify:FL=1|tara:strand:+ start:28852 stop:30525 length:1674 start_codon:yes stop_codon:yes gene_type:complete
MRSIAISAAALLASTLPAQARVAASFAHANITSQQLADTDGDGRQELLLVCHDLIANKSSLVRIGLDDNNQQLIQCGEIVLTDPAHTLIAVEDLLPSKGAEVILATPRRTACMTWSADGVPGKQIVLSRSAKFRVRVDQPQLSPFVIDLNKDGLLDLMMPSLDGVQPYFQVRPKKKLGEDSVPVFRSMAPFGVPVSAVVDSGGGGIDQELTGRIRIPQIDTEDLNGDGRPDLLTKEGFRRAYHLQRADGTFEKPIELDLKQFVDSTPKAAMDLGSTAVLSDNQMMQRGDVNGDGIPDHVIAHRRKIWTFLGNASGPQFQQARTQAVADDVTQLLLIDLDRDNCDDLLTFRVQLPGLATIVLALVRSIDIDVRAVGYQSEKTGFAGAPKWRRTVTVRIPPLLTLLGQQEQLMERFSNLINKARISARGEFLSAGRPDLALVTEDNSTIQLFPNVPAAPDLDSQEGAEMLGDLLFKNENTVFDIDRIFGLASGFLDRMNDQSVGDRKPTASIKLRDVEQWHLTKLTVGEFDGKPGEELLLTYRAANDPTHRAYDLIAWF